MLFQVVRYYAVAAVVAAGYLAVFGATLALGLHYYLGIVIAQVVTISWAFPLYRRVVFRSSGRLGADFVRFLSVWAGGMVAGFILTPVLVELVGVAPFWAQLATMVVVSVASFAAHRLFTFRQPRKSSGADSAAARTAPAATPTAQDPS